MPDRGVRDLLILRLQLSTLSSVNFGALIGLTTFTGFFQRGERGWHTWVHQSGTASALT
jgi:hypothetical protein